jgi:hypothetical protein
MVHYFAGTFVTLAFDMTTDVHDQPAIRGGRHLIIVLRCALRGFHQAYDENHSREQRRHDGSGNNQFAFHQSMDTAPGVICMGREPDKSFDRPTAFASFRPVFTASFSFYGWFAGWFSRANSRRLR